MRLLGRIAAAGVTVLLLSASASALAAQGVTTSSLIVVVTDTSGIPIPDARVTAVHLPSGTSYAGVSRSDGRAVVPGMRIGGPYRVMAAAIGFESRSEDQVYLNLGVSTDLRFRLARAAVALEEIVVTAAGEAVFSSERTGAATAVPREALATLPTVTGRIEDFTRLTPQVRGSNFVGQDNRLNNITVDGSSFNNSFGLAGQPGDRTGVAPISIDAIEQIQINIAPYDVRQGNFVGAGVNTVTKSGTNEFSGSLYYSLRNESFVGKKAGDLDFNPGTFDYNKFGAYLGGPIIRDRLFFFASYEGDGVTQPGTTFTANVGGEEVGGSKTRVLASDLDALSNFLSSNFGFDPGGYTGYSFETPATRILAKLDFNLNERNKFSVRYNHLDSDTDVLVSNSSSLGAGTRRSNTTGLNFSGSNYKILENIRSLVGEWNSIIGSNMSNNLIVGYTHQDESRGAIGTLFPFVDIREGSSVYTSFGSEPFTPNNELRYNTFQIQNNFSVYTANHDLTFGVSAERYESENVFFPGSQSVYTYNSLDDFYADANDHLANPNRTTSPITLSRFQVRWSNIPGLEKPVQPLKVFFAGLYAQDEWRVGRDLKVTLGLRVDAPWFGETGFVNPQANTFTFRDENKETVQYRTEKLPNPNLLFSPRIGFNWSSRGRARNTQVRGGTGIFTGRPAYVWISNQIGENGMLTGFEQLNNTTARPFHPDPDHYKPAEVSGNPASSYGLAFTDPEFKFPQLWRSNLAIDHRLPKGFVGTAEFIYNRDVNGIYYINANLRAPNSQFVGADNRPRWTSSSLNRIYSNVTSAIVMKNQNDGYSWMLSGSLEKAFSGGLFAKAAYSYGIARNTVDPGSIAFGSWNNNQHSGDGNNPGVAYSVNNPGHRVFATVAYRRDWFRFGGTGVSLFWEARTLGNASYTFDGDLNGDGGTTNDLIYIPRNMAEMNFEPYSQTIAGTAYSFTAQQQAEAFEAYIQQDKYLREHRGEYAERNGVRLPMVFGADLSITQDFHTQIRGRRNKLQFRVDILNVGNLISNGWGQGQRLVNFRPLISPGADSEGRAKYRLRNIGGELMDKTFEPTSGILDVYRFQFSVRYTWN